MLIIQAIDILVFDKENDLKMQMQMLEENSKKERHAR